MRPTTTKTDAKIKPIVGMVTAAVVLRRRLGLYIPLWGQVVRMIESVRVQSERVDNGKKQTVENHVESDFSVPWLSPPSSNQRFHHVAFVLTNSQGKKRFHLAGSRRTFYEVCFVRIRIPVKHK